MIYKNTKLATSISKKMIVASLMAVATLSATALSTNYYASSSRLSTGHWVRVKVSNEGIQQISYDNLRAWGFTNPENVKVYGYGGTLLSDHIFSTTKPDDVQPTLCMHTEDGRLLFFGDAEVRTTLNGIDSNDNILYNINRNYTSNYGFYLLTDAEVGGSTPTAVACSTSATSTLDEHLSVNLYEEEKEPVCDQTVIFHSKTYAAGGGQYITTNFDVRDYADGDNNYGTYAFEVALLNTTVWSTYTISGATCDDLTLSTTQSCTVDTSYDGSLYYTTGTGRSRVTPGEDETTIADGTYTFSSLIPKNSKLTFAALDRAVFIYPRKNIMHAQDGALLMNFQSANANTNFKIEGATSTTHVWNVTNPSSVYEHLGTFDATNQTFIGSFDHEYSSSDTSEACRLIAFDASQQQNEVEYVGEVDNQNIHGDSTPDMIIITTDELLSYANTLADAHRSHDGMDVNVYTQQQIFNEFGSGTPSTMAVRRAIKMFYDRDNSKLKYVLMYGKSLADFRHIYTDPSYDPLITFEVEPVTSDMRDAAANAHINFASDDYFGYLKDTDTPTQITKSTATMDIAVGRIPASNTGFASDVNNKLISYIEQDKPADLPLKALLVSDNGDSNQHFKQSLNVKDLLLSGNPSTTVTQGHCLIYPHTSSSAKTLTNVVKETLNNGVGYFCYTGHGAEIGFAAEYIWTTTLVNNTDYTYAPIAMLSTCNTSTYDRSVLAIAEAMLRKNNGGMIGVVGSARSVLLDANKLLCEAFTKAYAGASGKVRIGELYKTAHNNAIKNSSRLSERLNTMCYILLADPAITLSFPEKSVTFTDINGVNLAEYSNASSESTDESETAASTLTFNPKSYVNIRGYVADANGNIDKSFNGKATVTIYEAPQTVSTILVDSKDLEATATLDDTVLGTAVATVENGVIDANVYVPYNTYVASADNTNRIVIVAENSDNETACGVNTQAYIAEDSENNNEITIIAPEISEFYIDKIENGDNSIIGTTSPTLVADITLGTAGLNTSGKIGAATSLYLDGVKQTCASNAFVVGTDGNASLQYTLSDLSEGDHVVVLTVSDYEGNRVQKTLSFTVQEIDGDITLTADKKSVYETVTFEMSHTFYDEPDTRFIIEDSQRNTVLSLENATFPYEWNLKDSDGKQVANGYYNAYVKGKYGNKNASSDKVEIVVLAK